MAKSNLNIKKPVRRKDKSSQAEKRTAITETLGALPIENETYHPSNPPFEIHDQLSIFFPQQTEEEFEELLDSVKKEGVREPLLVWKDGAKTWLVDGHNRLRAAEAHQTPFKIAYLEAENLAEVKHWMLTNQLGRRNLTKQQLKKFWTKIAIENTQHGGDRKSRGQNVPLKLEQIAERVGASSRTIKRWMKEEREKEIRQQEKQANPKQVVPEVEAKKVLKALDKLLVEKDQEWKDKFFWVLQEGMDNRK